VPVRATALVNRNEESAKSTPYKFGAMIELPRAAVCAGSIAKEVDFLSFGTNDLTQMTFGFSRDDARKYLDAYIEAGILKKDPFITIDREGVGALMQMAIERARESNPEIKIGVCGEHSGDPESIEFLGGGTRRIHCPGCLNKQMRKPGSITGSMRRHCTRRQKPSVSSGTTRVAHSIPA